MEWDRTTLSRWRNELNITGYLVTDARSLFDHCMKCGHMANERQTALDILQVKDLIQKYQVQLRWNPTFKQLADGLTKEVEQQLLRDLNAQV